MYQIVCEDGAWKVLEEDGEFFAYAKDRQDAEDIVAEANRIQTWEQSMLDDIDAHELMCEIEEHERNCQKMP